MHPKAPALAALLAGAFALLPATAQTPQPGGTATTPPAQASQPGTAPTTQAPQPKGSSTATSRAPQAQTTAKPGTPAGKTQPAQAAGAAMPPGVGSPPPPGPHPYKPERFAGRAGKYYRLVWGVDELSVKWAESGEVIRFSYRVLDASKAKALNDKANQPLLNDPKAGVQLVVPQMENIGQLRQSAPPEAGRSYWVAFSNKGRLVKRGDHVIVQIGPFKADGLVVD